VLTHRVTNSGEERGVVYTGRKGTRKNFWGAKAKWREIRVEGTEAMPKEKKR